jgi:hypothetical protein
LTDCISTHRDPRSCFTVPQANRGGDRTPSLML